MSPSRRAILEALMAADAPQSLDDLFTAGVAGLSRTGIYRQLQGMAEEGIVERTGARQDARYAPREQMAFAWSLRLGRSWRMLEWTAEPPLDIQFPLASRLPDVAGRETLVRFLAKVQAQRLDQPWQLFGEAIESGAFKEDTKRLSETSTKEFYSWLRNPGNHGSFTVIAFGSCARGTARRDSDLDLLVVTPPASVQEPPPRTFEDVQLHFPGIDYEGILLEEALDLEAAAPRPIDLKVVQQDEVPDLPPGLLQAIIREGITVHANRPSADWVETWNEQWGSLQTGEGG